MNLKAGLWQQQTLKLTMTQELSQAIALLQYSAQELTEFLENKALENPFITIGDAPGRKSKKKKRTAEKKTDWIEQIADKSVSLEEQLLSQLNFKKYSKLQLSIIKDLVKHLDESGYFVGDTEEIAQKRDVSKDLVEECLKIIQSLEPVGVGARNLQECLLLQMEWEYPDDELGQKLISEHFHLFAEKKWKVLAKDLHVTVKEIQDVFDRVQLLNPKPCAKFSADQTHYIIPDAIIEVTREGISVRLWEAATPSVHFNESYYKQCSTSGDPHTGKFIQEKFQDYQWMIKSIEQRKETLTNVIRKITEKQAEFFLKGPQYLNPLTMKELALELGVHKSTISRAVREKFVQTPFGTIPLKSFFSSTIQTVSDANTSASQVKNAISLLIEKENKLHPLSDQEVVEILKAKEGIVVSRRTVAKYRDQLGIPSSAKRKRY